jgi:hypothetical protein
MPKQKWQGPARERVERARQQRAAEYKERRQVKDQPPPPAKANRVKSKVKQALKDLWQCPRCKAHNYLIRPTCFRCEFRRPANAPKVKVVPQKQSFWDCKVCGCAKIKVASCPRCHHTRFALPNPQRPAEKPVIHEWEHETVAMSKPYGFDRARPPEKEVT